MAVVEGRFRCMASEAHVVVVGGDDGHVSMAVGRLSELEQRWSRFVPSSDVARINLAGGQPVTVHADTLTLVHAMVSAWDLTGGRFDPTVLPVLARAGYRSSIDDPRRLTPLPDVELRIGGLADVVVDEARSAVTIPSDSVIDPGGIGKGLAADLVVGELLAAGATGVLVAVGGDMAFGGRSPRSDGWLVTIEDPDDPDREIARISVDAAGVATSSTRSRRWRSGSTMLHHLVDPSSGAVSTTGLASVTVVAATGWLAEIHATAAILAGVGGVADYLDTHRLSGVGVTSARSLVTSADLAERRSGRGGSGRRSGR